MRFPEFSGEWRHYTLGDFCDEFQSGKTIKADSIHSTGQFPVYGGNGLRGYTDSFNHSGEYVLIGRQGALCGNIRFVQGDNYITEHAIAVRANVDNDTRFLRHLFTNLNLGQYSDQSAQPGLAVNKLVRIPAYAPYISEQTKIATFLDLLDLRIATQSKIIEDLTTLRSALHHQIMRNGLADGSWEHKMLSEVLSERTELNSEGHAVHSVSVSKGIVNQIEYLGRSFAAKDTSKYHVACPGDIVYTKSPTGEFPYGIVKQSQITIKAALSPLYGVYTPASSEIGYIIHNHFLSPKNALNYLHPLIQKGAKNTINITNQRFLQNTIPLPLNQNAADLYSRTIRAVSDKIAIEESILNKLQLQKSYFLQAMFI